MEISGGIARGMVLEVPRGLDVRPTSIRARRALFDSLGDFSGKRVCDLFAGSGALGLEAVSRGAASLLAVEEAAPSIAVIRKNVAGMVRRSGIEAENIRVLQGKLPDCIRNVAGTPSPDIIFADPPYALTRLAELPDLILDKGMLAPEGMLILEHGKDHSFADHPCFVQERIYGSVHFSFFEPRKEEE